MFIAKNVRRREEKIKLSGKTDVNGAEIKSMLKSVMRRLDAIEHKQKRRRWSSPAYSPTFSDCEYTGSGGSNSEFDYGDGEEVDESLSVSQDDPRIEDSFQKNDIIPGGTGKENFFFMKYCYYYCFLVFFP